jgi:DNA-binding CsgD family transcriptional regulator
MFVDEKQYNIKEKRLHKDVKRYKGKTYAEWAQELGVHQNRVAMHIKKHGHLDLVGTAPQSKPSTYKGKTYSEWAEELNMTWAGIAYAIKKYGNLDNMRKKPTYKGKTYVEWAKELDESLQKIASHIKKHGNLDNIHRTHSEAMSLVGQANAHTYKGKTIGEWAKELDVAKCTIRDHIAKHGHLDYVKLTNKEKILLRQLKKDEANSEIFN